MSGVNLISFPHLGISFNLNEIAIPIPALGNGGVRWYALIIVTGILLAIYLGIRECKRIGEDPDHVYSILLWALPLSVIGARIYYALFSLDYYVQNPAEIIAIWNGGMAIYGAVITAFVITAIYCKRHKLKLSRYLDLAAYGFLIGQIVGRWGNFVNGEAFGTATDFLFGMSINGGAPVHPTFLYESVWNLILFLFLWLTRKKRGFDGRVISFYMLFYGIGRCIIEGMRADSLMLGNLRVSQALSFVLAIAGLCLYFYFKEKRRKEA